MKQFKDLHGKKYGRLTVVSRAQNTPKGTARWNCVCDCGNVSITTGINLRRGTAKSCGCLQKEIAKISAEAAHNAAYKHGHGCGTREYHTWVAMRQRCHNSKNNQYKNYGARGITVCERWEVFANFLIDMGAKPDGASLDRIDNNLGYFPENCRWATLVEQNNNTRANVIVEYKGNSITISEATRLSGGDVSPRIARQRIRRGWPIERAVV